MKTGRSALRAPAIDDGICDPDPRPPCSYRLTHAMSMNQRMQACPLYDRAWGFHRKKALKNSRLYSSERET